MLELYCEMQVNDQFFGSWAISALEHVMQLILCSCVLSVFINRIFQCEYFQCGGFEGDTGSA